jgi:hypothetical protein
MKYSFLKMLAVVMIMLTGLEADAYDFTLDGIYYNITSTTDLTCSVTFKDAQYKSYSGTVVIPSAVKYNDKTYNVTAVDEKAFYRCYNMTSVTIPGTVTTIGNYAFNSCTDLREVIFQDGGGVLELGYSEKETDNSTVGKGLFSGCPLDYVYVGRSLSYDDSMSCGYSPFYNQTSMTGLAFGNSVYSVGRNAFQGCSGITDVNFGSGIVTIGSFAFDGCSKIQNVKLGEKVTYVGEYTFRNCSKLQTVDIPSIDTTVISRNAFENCSALTSFVCKKVFHVSQYAFYKCTSLVNVTLADQISIIEQFAFYNCSKLSQINLTDKITEIGMNAFYGCSGLTSITIPSSMKLIGLYAFRECSGLKSLIIPDEVDSVAAEAFENCSGLTSVVIGKGIHSIDHGTFYGCSSLTSLTIGENVKRIEWGAFYYDAMNQVTMPNSVESVNDFAFASCKRLTKVTIGSKVNYLGQLAFKDCDSLIEVNSLNPTPPANELITTFTSKVYANATLNITKGSLEAYKADRTWSQFNKIVEKFEPGGVDDISTNNSVKIAVSGSNITVTCEGIQAIQVYNIAGVKLYDGTDQTVAVPASGIYIVRVSGKSYKIAVK